MNALEHHQLAAIRAQHDRFVRHGIEYWLFGGWAVDFYVGRVTRTHDDIDLAIWQMDLKAVDRVLRDAGWVLQPRPGEDGYTDYGNGAIHPDLALLACDADGIVYPHWRKGAANGAREHSARTRGIRGSVRSARQRRVIASRQGGTP
jgi:hypothetical protein